MSGEVQNQAYYSAGSRLVRGAASGLFLNILSNAFLFVGQLIIPRMLSRTEYAQFTVSISFVVMMSLVADLGMNSLFTRVFSEAEEDASVGHPDRRGKLIGSALALRVGLALIVAALVLLIAPQLYSSGMVVNMQIVLITIFISSRLLIVRAVGESILKSRGKFYLAAAFALADAVAFAIALLICSGDHLSVSQVLFIYSFSNLPGFALLCVSTARWCRTERILLRVDWHTILEFIRGALPLSVAIGFLTIHTEIDKLLLDRLSSPYEVSSYGAMVRLISAVIPIPLVIAYVAAPELTRLMRRGDHVKSKRLTGLVLRFLMVSAGIIIVTLLPSSTMAATLFLGAKYSASGYLLQYMGWMLLPIFISTFLTEMSIAAGKSWPFTVYATILMAAVILGDFILIPSYGAAGAMISKLIAVSLGCVGLLGLLWKSEFLTMNLLTKLVLKVIVAMSMAFIINIAIPVGFISPWIESALLLVVFLCLVHLLKILSISDVHSLFSRIKVETTGETI